MAVGRSAAGGGALDGSGRSSARRWQGKINGGGGAESERARERGAVKFITAEDMNSQVGPLPRERSAAHYLPSAPHVLGLRDISTGPFPPCRFPRFVAAVLLQVGAALDSAVLSSLRLDLIPAPALLVVIAPVLLIAGAASTDASFLFVALLV
jgi:hypothetical protein